jgi:hypothetical protein
MAFERLRRVLTGSSDTIAGSVYGTIIVMATIAAGGKAESDAWRLAVLVSATVVVLWFAHVYAHALGESVQLGHRLDPPEFVAVARREASIVLAGVAPVAALVLGAAGVVRESRAIWLALVLGLVTLAAQGLRYAQVEHLGRFWTAVSVGTNLALGLVIVGLKALLGH